MVPCDQIRERFRRYRAERRQMVRQHHDGWRAGVTPRNDWSQGVVRDARAAHSMSIRGERLLCQVAADLAKRKRHFFSVRSAGPIARRLGVDVPDVSQAIGVLIRLGAYRR